MATKTYADGDGTKWTRVPYFMTGCNRLAFNRVWSVRRVLKARERYTYGADSVGGTLYEYGELPPNHSVPAIILDVTLRPMGTAIWRCYDGIEGDRFTIECKWWKGTHIN